MLKYNSILVKIKLFYLIVTGKIKKNNDKIVISKDKNIQLSNVCMIFPIDNEDFRVATYTFRNLLKNSNINYHFFINTVHKHTFVYKQARESERKQSYINILFVNRSVFINRFRVYKQLFINTPSLNKHKQ